MRDWLKEKRKKKRLTMGNIASACGISISHYCLIEKGERRPSVEVAKTIGKMLGIKWETFFD